MSATSVDALKSQLQSARKALLFMETEHAKTLHGLHDEIKSLQKRCNGKQCHKFIYNFSDLVVLWGGKLLWSV